MIRKYKNDDAKSIKAIAYSDDVHESLRAASAIKCNYYIENEPEHCFVMTDEFDNPTGYILCSIDAKKFNSLLPTYLAIVKDENKKLYRAEKRLHKKLAAVGDDYPARISISILPSFRGKGGAKALIAELVAHLKQIGVRGVYTVAESDGAVAFCERMGFERLLRVDKSRGVYGLHIEV
ncbi:MAG: GNAT family N-acetyltransferase [Bacteroides sp.]|nr:GNAT family N-acetyltransferase [Bacillota bacterium]MCM1393721.1 GNAT family N-acetyltransferase [[Eubacterium] siraeum]MCM1455239.1 GNAT family N-acetyltransferase [Bacteroides sp.]